jgi:hypothetical protein
MNASAPAQSEAELPPFEAERAGARLGGRILTGIFLTQVAGVFLHALIQFIHPPYLQAAFLRNPGRQWEDHTLINVLIFAGMSFLLFFAFLFALVARGRSLRTTLAVLLASAATLGLIVASDVQMTNYVIREQGLKVEHTFSFLLPHLAAPSTP